jgi:hypothetical protein
LIITRWHERANRAKASELHPFLITISYFSLSHKEPEQQSLSELPEST